MIIFQIVGIGIIASILAVVLKQQNKSQFALQLSIATGIIIFLFVSTQLKYVIDTLNTLSNKVNLDFLYFSTILKIIGIAYIVEFGAQISRDAGESAIASKIELAGKVLIMVISVPIMMGVVDLIIKIMP